MISFLAAAVLAASSPARAAAPGCFDRHPTPAAAEAACSPLISKLDAAGDRGEALAKALLYRGYARAASGAAENAISDFGRAAELAATAFPDIRAGALLERGALRLKAGRADEALADLAEVRALKPKWTAARYLLGIAKARRGDEAGGRADVEAAKAEEYMVDVDAADSWGLIAGNRAELLAECRKEGFAANVVLQSAACASLIDAGLAAAGERADILARLGYGLFRLGRHEKSLKALDEALTLDASNGYVFMTRADARAALKRDDAALADYDRAIALVPDHALLFVKRGEFHFARRRWARALADFDKAVALQPEEADYRINRGKAQSRLGRHDAALQDFEKAVALGDSYNGGRVGRGVVFLLRGKNAKALAAFEEAVKADDRDIYARWGRALARRRTKDAKGAAEDEARALGQNKTTPALMAQNWGVGAPAPKK